MMEVNLYKNGESLANIRAHPWNGWTVTSSELSVLWTVKPSIPATSAAVSCAPDGCVRLSGTVTSPVEKSLCSTRRSCRLDPSKKSVIHPLMWFLPVGWIPEEQSTQCIFSIMDHWTLAVCHMDFACLPECNFLIFWKVLEQEHGYIDTQ